ncbi:hypothetical protein [Limnoglobus roseus]|uniref:hypothetical protein n=1 Tax=Limnoglobus roseus TaxID=2598579 RepID=UPI0011EB43AC|nr:hypothetical protein [Limnoglobus roseus]
MPRPEDFPQQPMTDEQLARWADRIADGRDAFPADPADADRTRLADAVRRRLRDRFIHHVARAIAARVARAVTPTEKSSHHAPTQV